MKRFGVFEKLDVPVARLSGGEKQRVAIARCFLKGAKILILDEPTASLDKTNSKLVFETIREASKDVLCLVSTHNQELASAYADVCFTMEDGKVVDVKGAAPADQKQEQKPAVKAGKGRMPWLYAWKTLWNKKAKATAMTVVSTLSLFFLMLGSAFAFFDSAPAFESALVSNETWFLPLYQHAELEDGVLGLPISQGAFYRESMAKNFDKTFVYRSGQNVSQGRVHTSLNVISYFEGLTIHGTKIERPGSGEAVISSFFHDIAGDSFSISVFGVIKPFVAKQLVPVEYDQKEMIRHCEDSTYQDANESRFSSYLTYAVVSPEDLDSFRDASRGVSLYAANCFDPSMSLDRYVQSVTTFYPYRGEELLLGRAPQNEFEIVAPESALFSDPSASLESYLGMEASFVDLNKTDDPRRYAAKLNVYDIVPKLTIVGISSTPWAYIDDALLEKFSFADWENEASMAVYPNDAHQVAKTLSGMEFQSYDADFAPIYRFHSIKNSGLGIAFVVVEILLIAMSTAIGFSLGQDGVAGKEREIALLLTIGHGEKDFLLRYLLGNGIFLAIAYSIALLSSGISVWLINGMAAPGAAYVLFPFPFLGALIAFASSFLTAFLSSLGSLHRLSRLQIAEIFRGLE